jgi:hypothetical protein
MIGRYSITKPSRSYSKIWGIITRTTTPYAKPRGLPTYEGTLHMKTRRPIIEENRTSYQVQREHRNSSGAAILQHRMILEPREAFVTTAQRETSLTSGFSQLEVWKLAVMFRDRP